MPATLRPIPVRPATPDDFDAWLPLWQGYQAFYRVTIPPDATRITWARFHDPGEPMHCALALGPDGCPTGLVHWLTHRSTWTTGDYCYLQDLFVAASARGLGLGRHLIEHVCADAQARGCSRVHWLTHETNTDAMHLYDRLADKPGFVQYRRLLAP